MKTTMAFRIKSGSFKVEWFPKAASVAISVGDMLVFSSGNVTPAAAGNSTSNFAGIALKPAASADSDYASNTFVPVAVPTPENLIEADIGTGTAAASNVGLSYDLAAAGTLDLTATTHKNFVVKAFISTTKVLGKFIPLPEYKDVV